MREINEYFKRLTIREKLGLLPSLIFLIFLIDLAFYDIFLAVKIMLLDIIILIIIEKLENLTKKGNN